MQPTCKLCIYHCCGRMRGPCDYTLWASLGVQIPEERGLEGLKSSSYSKLNKEGI
jgi:hypothetical protein